MAVAGCVCLVFFFFKQKTAYEMRISDWSSDVCSSDLRVPAGLPGFRRRASDRSAAESRQRATRPSSASDCDARTPAGIASGPADRSEEHTSELQSLMRTSYAVFCLKKKILLQK